jgi:hypothetical protein
MTLGEMRTLYGTLIRKRTKEILLLFKERRPVADSTQQDNKQNINGSDDGV